MDQVHVVTGGFYGVGDVIGRSYHEKRSQLGRPSNIWHVLPKRDSQVHKHHFSSQLEYFEAGNLWAQNVEFWGLTFSWPFGIKKSQVWHLRVDELATHRDIRTICTYR